MQVPQRAQRLSYLVGDVDDAAAKTLVSQLSSLNGVLEATVVVNEQRCYLKVSSTGFDPKQVEALLSRHS